jgi:hypothetical protein
VPAVRTAPARFPQPDFWPSSPVLSGERLLVRPQRTEAIIAALYFPRNPCTRREVGYITATGDFTVRADSAPGLSLVAARLGFSEAALYIPNLGATWHKQTKDSCNHKQSQYITP